MATEPLPLIISLEVEFHSVLNFWSLRIHIFFAFTHFRAHSVIWSWGFSLPLGKGTRQGQIYFYVCTICEIGCLKLLPFRMTCNFLLKAGYDMPGNRNWGNQVYSVRCYVNLARNWAVFTVCCSCVRGFSFL